MIELKQKQSNWLNLLMTPFTFLISFLNVSTNVIYGVNINLLNHQINNTQDVFEHRKRMLIKYKKLEKFHNFKNCISFLFCRSVLFHSSDKQ